MIQKAVPLRTSNQWQVPSSVFPKAMMTQCLDLVELLLKNSYWMTTMMMKKVGKITQLSNALAETLLQKTVITIHVEIAAVAVHVMVSGI
jgi:hypothetical protein